MHPPLDYLLARGVETFGPVDWARKLLDVLWGAATVPAMGLLIARRAGRAAGLIAPALLALAPFHVRYSQEFRPYALGLFLLCLSLLCLDRFLERPGMFRLVALYVACLATAYTLYLAAMVLGLAALAILVEDSFDEEPSRRRPLAVFSSGALSLPPRSSWPTYPGGPWSSRRLGGRRWQLLRRCRSRESIDSFPSSSSPRTGGIGWDGREESFSPSP
ncbi:MAG TPA: glycosyltransferase family 39 protein [Thermoanaerobaculia bacterium]|nr:glycosyltransferase family 39 protein [Thermoanaerobaculia bacterium]